MSKRAIPLASKLAIIQRKRASISPSVVVSSCIRTHYEPHENANRGHRSLAAVALNITHLKYRWWSSGCDSDSHKHHPPLLGFLPLTEADGRWLAENIWRRCWKKNHKLYLQGDPVRTEWKTYVAHTIQVIIFLNGN